MPMTDIHDKAIEAAARAIAETALAGDYSEVPLREIFPTPRARYMFLHERYMAAARAAIAAYEAARVPQHTRATALLRRVLAGPRPAHGPLDVYDDIAAFLRETDNG